MEFFKIEFDSIVEYYSFLDEGDFEEYQPYCYMDKDSEQFKAKKAEVDRIEPTTARLSWIKSRFMPFASKEHLEQVITTEDMVRKNHSFVLHNKKHHRLEL